MVHTPAGPLDELQDRLARSRSALWDLPGITRDAVVAWADNRATEFAVERRSECCEGTGPRQHDREYARFRKLADAGEIEHLLAWYVRHLVPAAALTEAIKWGVTVYPPGRALVRVNIGMVETLVISRDDERTGFINVRGSVIEAAFESNEVTLGELFGPEEANLIREAMADDSSEPDQEQDLPYRYANVGEDHLLIDFQGPADAQRLLSIPVVARAARLLNAALLPGSSANARKGHAPAILDRAFVDGQLQSAT